MNSLAKYSLATMFATAVIAVPLVFAAKPPPPPPIMFNVTTIVQDEDSSTIPITQWYLRSDDYNGVFQASYNDPNNYGSTMSLTFSGWNLSLYNQSLRRIWLTLSHPVAGSPISPAPDGYYSEKVQVFSRCYDGANQRLPTSNLQMTAGQTNSRCDLGVDFASGRTQYGLMMSPAVSGTGWATVTCNTQTGGTTGDCNSWTISPNMVSGFGNVPTVAKLSRGSTDVGLYYLTFRIDVTNP